jgi:hypothetical protein
MNFNRLLSRFKTHLPIKHNRADQQQADYEIEKGLPPGIEWEILDSLCKNNYASEIKFVCYQHLSAWKISGAYRILIHLANGKEQQLIFKESHYNEEEIPGLVGLPVNLALPEYIIYRQNSLQPLLFLPKVFLAEEIVAGQKYRYIFEDLSQEYKRIHHGSEILQVTTQFNYVYRKFNDWSHRANLSGLIHYDKDFSRSLQKYAYENIIHLDEKASDPILYQVINQWSEICSVHMLDEFHQYPRNHLIHGDLNFSNIHIHQRDPKLIKMVDWEWAGFGTPLSDFVSLTKGASPHTKTAAYKNLAGSTGEYSPFKELSQDQRLFKRMVSWCQIERGMLDAGFLSAQYSNSSHSTRFSLPKAINSSLERLFDAYLQLIN